MVGGVAGVAGSLLVRQPENMVGGFLSFGAGLIFLRARKLADSRQVFWHIAGGFVLIGLLCGYGVLING
jgi:hypothetical protein